MSRGTGEGTGNSKFTLEEEEDEKAGLVMEPRGGDGEEVKEGVPAVPPPRGIAKYLPSPVLAFCATGIIGSLMLYAYLQEKIMSSPYTDPEDPTAPPEYFKVSVFIVMITRICAAVVAGAVLLAQGNREELAPRAPLHKFFAVSCSNVIATTCQYEALKFVNMPTQTLAKCGKMIPVMIWGTFLSKKKYNAVDYCVAALVAIGCTIFLTSGNISSRNSASENSWYGLLLMAGYLGFDGFTSTFQESLFAGYQMTIYNQMLYVNLCSAMVSFITLLVSKKLFEALAFIAKYPRSLLDALLLSTSAVSGQFFITYTIKSFGALAYATIMTIRQFLTVFLSNIVFGHQMTLLQWTGAITVFGALFFKSWYKAYTSGK
uniref:Sugar phosphate transporter domain-containing protein n=1 Tax=Compsopogon caeruleus TaxID=31354 RepID=A0A7S1TB20_9RHOD|mmetsp:Transcript_15335/g.31111  ORF Transcript_15335/g.31111 Transcript_15335/m.31111 type:complete len:374 (+) Transcript_15335:70-1191(+)|eukprot:CAMPEP_0184685922 /NCGR_PEP_ID=MMETSP0312-20130426/20669_1 /TAXON_ID=31354 /ORGANISM="Compsopogon coeruleus, Strain SAG 36.94" /LENGTH=373 /DNA_ID=CAMNT_0027140507 /DNA_START=22 /DNA_END=1143 /DNA_ORIENTATION=+